MLLIVGLVFFIVKVALFVFSFHKLSFTVTVHSLVVHQDKVWLLFISNIAFHHVLSHMSVVLNLYALSHIHAHPLSVALAFQVFVVHSSTSIFSNVIVGQFTS